MCCFVILLLSNEMQMSVRRFSAIPHLRATSAPRDNHHTKKSVLILGDSMIKGLQYWKMCREDTKVNLKYFPGATTEDMESYVIPPLRRNPDEVIIHVGTNDLRDKTSRQVAESVVNLSDNILQNSTANKVSIASVIHRNDDPALNSKISECNKILKSFASNRQWGYIDNSKIGSTMLNKGGLQLNHKGSSALAKNITSYLYKSH